MSSVSPALPMVSHRPHYRRMLLLALRSLLLFAGCVSHLEVLMHFVFAGCGW
jgi:hypothetical protein